jgi:hypothetical protein
MTKPGACEYKIMHCFDPDLNMEELTQLGSEGWRITSVYKDDHAEVTIMLARDLV